MRTGVTGMGFLNRLTVDGATERQRGELEIVVGIGAGVEVYALVQQREVHHTLGNNAGGSKEGAEEVEEVEEEDEDKVAATEFRASIAPGENKHQPHGEVTTRSEKHNSHYRRSVYDL